MGSRTITVAAVGDVMVDRDKPQSIFSLARHTIQRADISFCQLETAYSDKGSLGSSGPRGAMAHDVRNYSAIPSGGFTVASMASNHAMDWGADALMDCIGRLRGDGIAAVGAGGSIEEAREPAVILQDDVRIAFLSYCSVAPKGYYASKGKPGVAPMRAITHYEPLEEDQPGTPCEIITFPIDEDFEALKTDIRKARSAADVVVLSMHWGLHYFRAAIADYQRIVAHAAIDAGADIILGHHPHILKGVEVYKGKAILYSLGNFAFDSRPKAVDVVWHQRRQRVYQGIFKVPGRQEHSAYRFQPDSRNSMIAKFTISGKQIRQVSFVPVVINEHAQPESFSASDPKGMQVVQYLREITQEANLNAVFNEEGEEVVIVT